MNDKEKAKNRCNEIIEMCFGAELQQTWWSTKNAEFDQKTPNEVWETNHWGLVYAYLLDQLSGDYI